MKLEGTYKYLVDVEAEFLTSHVGGWLWPIGFYPVLHLLSIN
jgi:hypothetical protein